MIYVCSPSNPEGASLKLKDWKDLIFLARNNNAVLIVDECYTDIYPDNPPMGVLEACEKLNTDIWYDEKTLLWVKAAFDKSGRWEYRLKNYN